MRRPTVMLLPSLDGPGDQFDAFVRAPKTFRLSPRGCRRCLITAGCWLRGSMCACGKIRWSRGLSPVRWRSNWLLSIRPACQLWRCAFRCGQHHAHGRSDCFPGSFIFALPLPSVVLRWSVVGRHAISPAYS